MLQHVYEVLSSLIHKTVSSFWYFITECTSFFVLITYLQNVLLYVCLQMGSPSAQRMSAPGGSSKKRGRPTNASIAARNLANVDSWKSGKLSCILDAKHVYESRILSIIYWFLLCVCVCISDEDNYTALLTVFYLKKNCKWSSDLQ
jgi:hypothetical protein